MRLAPKKQSTDPVGKAVAFTKETKLLMNGPEQLKSLIGRFWMQFGGRKNNGVGFDRQSKLTALIELSNVVVPYKKQQPLCDRRIKFDSAKQKLHPWRRFFNCFVCGNSATARHHIVQLKNGGINSKKNVVSLCEPCHAKIHPWLRVLCFLLFLSVLIAV